MTTVFDPVDLAGPHRTTLYGGDDKRYTDYPTYVELQQAEGEPVSTRNYSTAVPG